MSLDRMKRELLAAAIIAVVTLIFLNLNPQHSILADVFMLAVGLFCLGIVVRRKGK